MLRKCLDISFDRTECLKCENHCLKGQGEERS